MFRIYSSEGPKQEEIAMRKGEKSRVNQKLKASSKHFGGNTNYNRLQYSMNFVWREM